MRKKARRGYDKAFKLMAVELHRSGKVAVAKELGIDVGMLRRWTREHSEHDTRSFSRKWETGSDGRAAGNQSEKKALHESGVENRILKKAVSIFSREDNKYSGS